MVYGLVKAIARLRDTHLKKCKRTNAMKKFYNLWETLAYDIAMNDIIKYWDLLDNK